MYSMKETCKQVNMSYETLKFYCNKGLIPNVKRDQNNFRVFNEKDIAWIKSLVCLKKCGFSIQDMKVYLKMCLDGPKTIAERKEMLAKKQKILFEELKKVQESIDYINWKQQFYDDVLSGKIEYVSNLTK